MASWDVEIDGAGFMIVPGTYRLSAIVEDRIAAQVSRQSVDDFSAGVAGPKDGGLFTTSAEGAWPAPWPVGTQGVGPGPKRQTSTGSVGTASQKFTTADDSYLFIAAGTSLHRWSGIGSPASRTTLPSSVTDMVRKADALFFVYDGGADVSRWVDGTGTHTPSVLGSGYKAHRIGATGNMLVTCDNANRDQIDVWNQALTTSTTRTLQGEVRRMVNYDNVLVIATDAALYAIEGAIYGVESLELWSIVSTSGVQADDDYAWMTVYQGRLLTWLGGRVVSFDAARGVWVPLGPEGATSSGAAEAFGWLFVAITPLGGGDEQLWGYNGSGWWLLDSDVSHPAAAGGGKLATFDAGTLHYYELDEPLNSNNLATPFALETALLDGGVPHTQAATRPKQWRRIGVELVRQDGETVGSWSFKLEHSTDGGNAWTDDGSDTVTSEATTVERDISATSTSLRLRVTGTRTSGLPPFVAAVWAEYLPLNGSARRRRWEFRVHARDRSVDRDGAADSRTGQQIRADLWALYDDASTVSFRDVDYGTTAVERNVRLTDLREIWRQPSDQPELGADTFLDVVLVEV